MTLDQQIKCLRDEQKRRKKVYPKLIEGGLMSKERAAYELAAFHAAIETLTQIKGIAERI